MANQSGIHIKKSHEGLLHEDLGIAADKPIPLSRLHSAMKHAGKKLKKRIVFAENTRKFKH